MEEGMSIQAQQIWSMLDDMSENDPKAYRNFIQRQMKEGREHLSPPDPHMCIQTTLKDKQSKAKLLFINFCEWKRVPEPKTPTDPVPVIGTPISAGQDDKGRFSLTSVAFNPKVLQEYGRDATNPVDADTLVQLALDYVENEQKVKVNRTYTVLPADTPFKGDISHVRLSFSKKFGKQEEKLEQEMKELEKTFGPLSMGERDSLISKLSNIGQSDDASLHPVGQSSNNSSSIGPPIHIGSAPNPAMKKGLIEEIKSTTVRNTNRLPAPKYSLEPLDADTGRKLVLRVQLPGVTSVSDCELDISEDDVQLMVPTLYDLKVKLPSCIDDELASAKFNKKLSVLTLTMPVKT